VLGSCDRVPFHFQAMKTLLRSVFDLGLYAEVHAQRLRRTFAHLFVLVLVTTLASTIGFAGVVRGWVGRLLPEVDKLPTITIKNGEASANVPQPWVKRLGETDRGNQLVLIIDTTGTRTGFEANEVGLFLQRRQLLIKGDDAQAHAVSLKRVGDRVIGPQLARRWLERARIIVPLVFAAVMLVVFWVTKTLQALLFTLVALIGAAGRRRPLGFGSLFTVAAHALGPPVLLDALLWLTPLRLPYAGLIYVGLAVVYTVLGVRRIPDEPTLTLVTP
jgi:hypothetical protein